MEINRKDLYKKVWQLSGLANLTIRQKRLLMKSRYGKFQVAMLTLSELQDLYEYLTSEAKQDESERVAATPSQV